MIYAMTCASEKYIKSMGYQLKTALLNGQVDAVKGFRIESIDDGFRKKNEKILSESIGAGLYIWKPYYINKALSEISWGDYLFYLDAGGSIYKSSLNPVVQCMESLGKDIICVRNFGLEKDYTKPETFVYMNCNTETYKNQKQVYAGIIIIKKTTKTTKLMEEWLSWCLRYSVISNCGNNKSSFREGFISHRYDQSILSLLYARENIAEYSRLGIKPFWTYHHSRRTTIFSIYGVKAYRFIRGVIERYKRIMHNFRNTKDDIQ